MYSQWFDSEAAELEFLLNHPFIGGDGEGDQGQGDQGQGAEGKSEHQGTEGDDANSGDTGGKGTPKDRENWIPKHRFDEVNTQFTQYKEFGKPDDIKKKLARLNQLEALPQNRHSEKEKEEIRKELLSVLPEFAVMNQMLKTMKGAYTKRGATQNNTFLKEVGLEVNDKNNRYLQELLSGIIAEDQELLERFYGMDDNVFADAFAVAKKTFWPNYKKANPAALIQAKKIIPGAPAKQKDGETKDKKDGPMDRMGERDLMDKAGEEAFALLEGTRSE